MKLYNGTMPILIRKSNIKNNGMAMLPSGALGIRFMNRCRKICSYLDVLYFGCCVWQHYTLYVYNN